MNIEMIPYDNDWAIERTETEYIEVTCKDHNGEPQYLKNELKEIIFIGSLAQCNYAIQLNKEVNGD